LLCCFSIIRALYCFLIATGRLANDGTSASTAIVYILAELPTFLLFTAFSLMVMAWIATLVATSKLLTSNFMKTFKKVAIVGNAIMYSVLALIIILYYIIPNNTQESSMTSYNTCATLSDTTSSTSPQYFISVVYQSFQMIIAGLTSIGFVIFGRKINNSLNVRSISKRARISKVWGLTLICAVSFICHSVVLLILASTNTFSSGGTAYIVGIIVLTLVEVIPSASIILIYVKAPIDSKSKSSDSGTLKSKHEKTNEVDLPRIGLETAKESNSSSKSSRKVLSLDSKLSEESSQSKNNSDSE